MTRLIWVILFAVVVGLMLLFLVRAFQSGTGINQHLEQLNAARLNLEERYTGSSISFRARPSGSGGRNLAVIVEPDHAAPDEMADSILAVVRRDVDLTGYDSVVVMIADSAIRAAAVPGR